MVFLDRWMRLFRWSRRRRTSSAALERASYRCFCSNIFPALYKHLGEFHFLVWSRFPSKSSPSSTFRKERTLLTNCISWRDQSSSGSIPRDHSSICTTLLSFLAWTGLEESTGLLLKVSDGKCYFSKSKHMMYVTTRFFLWGLTATSPSTHLTYDSNVLSNSFKEFLSVSPLFALVEYCSIHRGCYIPSSWYIYIL